MVRITYSRYSEYAATNKQTCIHAKRHMHADKHTHKRTHARKQTHIHTQTHKHTYKRIRKNRHAKKGKHRNAVTRRIRCRHTITGQTLNELGRNGVARIVAPRCHHRTSVARPHTTGSADWSWYDDQFAALQSAGVRWCGGDPSRPAAAPREPHPEQLHPFPAHLRVGRLNNSAL